MFGSRQFLTRTKPALRRRCLMGILPLSVAAVAVVGAAEQFDGEVTHTKAQSTRTTSIVLTPLEQTRAEAWRLTPIEWKRYRSLMQGVRGSISPSTLSPIEVLGIHARDDRERRRYAERWAQMMYDDVDRILAFQRAYDEATSRLFRSEPMIDVTRLPTQREDTLSLRTDDRVLFFSRPDCVHCDVVLERLLERLDQIAGIDIYLSSITQGDVQAIRQWAAERGVEPQWVQARRVTLNFDAGALEQLGVGPVELPYLMRRRGDTVAVLPASAL